MQLNKTFKTFQQNLVLNDYLYTFIDTLRNQNLIIVEKKCYVIDNKPDSYLKIENIKLIQILTNTCLIEKYFTFLQSTHTINLVKVFFFQVKSWYRQLTTYLYPLQVHVYEKLIHRKLSEILLKIDSCTLFIPIKTTKF